MPEKLDAGNNFGFTLQHNKKKFSSEVNTITKFQFEKSYAKRSSEKAP